MVLLADWPMVWKEERVCVFFYIRWRNLQRVRLSKLWSSPKFCGRSHISKMAALKTSYFLSLLPYAKQMWQSCSGWKWIEMMVISKWNAALASEHPTYGYLETYLWGCPCNLLDNLVFFNTSDPLVVNFPESDLRHSRVWMRQQSIFWSLHSGAEVWKWTVDSS